MTIKTVAILLGEHPCIMNIFLGPVTVHYREVLLYTIIMLSKMKNSLGLLWIIYHLVNIHLEFLVASVM